MHFLDTNILLYAGSQAPEDHPKRQRAVALIREGDFALSAQVLQEFIANALGKKRRRSDKLTRACSAKLIHRV